MMYLFISPLDASQMWFVSLQSAMKAAREYIGGEDLWGDPITKIKILKVELATTVSGVGNPGNPSKPRRKRRE